MKQTMTYLTMYHLVSQLIGCRHRQACWEPTTLTLLTIRRLAKKHHRLAEMSCNGEGWLNGHHYYAGIIDEHNSSCVSAYVTDEVTVFDQKSEQIEAKITALVAQLGRRWSVEFQGDPRGDTVQVSYQGQWQNITF